MKLIHITIQTDKFDEEINFYNKYVNLTIQQDLRPAGRNIVFMSENKSDTCIEIIENKEAGFSGNKNLSIGFHSEDKAAKRNQLISAGFNATPMVSPMPGVEFFFVKDPAGVTVQFI